MSGWWDSITSSAQLLVDEISAQANEASNDIAKEQLRIRKEEESRQAKSLEALPWESDDESKSIISQALMAEILQLALSEQNFTEPPPAKIVECCNFDLQRYISQAMRLLSLDQNLAHIHAKVSPKMNEEVFWRNYFVRIYYLRCKSGILDTQDAIVQAVSSFASEDVILHTPTKGAAVATAGMAPAVEKKDKPFGLKVSAAPKISPAHTPPPPRGSWEHGSGSGSGEEEEGSGSGSSEMSPSSYDVVGASSGRSASASDNEKGIDVEDEEALFEAQLKAELEGSEKHDDDDEGVGDEDFEDLGDLDLGDLDDVGDDDDDAELEAQIARELANEE